MTMKNLLESFSTKNIWSRDTITNNQREYYLDPENPEHGESPFILSADGLTIKARRRDPNNENFTQQEYLSGILTTHKKPSIIPALRGEVQRISALLALPDGAGVWPAFWLLPEFDSWPSGIDILPELDVMEYLGEAQRFYTNIHTRNGGDVLNQDQYTHNCPDEDLTGFHWYHLERTESTIRFGFDNQWSKTVLTPSDLKGPLHVLLNLAVGGSWPEMVTGRPTQDTYEFKCNMMYLSETNENQNMYPAIPVESQPPTVLRPGCLKNLDDIRKMQNVCSKVEITEWLLALQENPEDNFDLISKVERFLAAMDDCVVEADAQWLSELQR